MITSYCKYVGVCIGVPLFGKLPGNSAQDGFLIKARLQILPKSGFGVETAVVVPSGCFCGYGLDFSSWKKSTILGHLHGKVLHTSLRSMVRKTVSAIAMKLMLYM